MQHYKLRSAAFIAWVIAFDDGCSSTRQPPPFHKRLWTATLVGLILIPLTGCPGMSVKDNERFQKLVSQKVFPGMSFVAAIEKLVKAGFSCDDRVSAPLVTCSLDRQSLLPYACFERVDLATDSDRRTVTIVTPRPIGCAGL